MKSKKCLYCEEIAVVRLTDIAPMMVGKRGVPINICHEHFKNGAMVMYGLIHAPRRKVKKRTPSEKLFWESKQA